MVSSAIIYMQVDMFFIAQIFDNNRKLHRLEGKRSSEEEIFYYCNNVT